MAVKEFTDPEGRSHWADEDSEFAKSGLESGHLSLAGQPASEQGDETGEEGASSEEQGDAEQGDAEQGDAEQGDAEQGDETGEEGSDAAVEQDGDGADADGDANGSGDPQPSRRGSRRR